MFTPNAIITQERRNSNQELGHTSVTGQADVYEADLPEKHKIVYIK